jgi:hypothetical protein
MFGVDQCFGKHCSCHLQGGYVGGQVLETLYRARSEWWDRFDGADWWSGLLSNGRGASGWRKEEVKEVLVTMLDEKGFAATPFHIIAANPFLSNMVTRTSFVTFPQPHAPLPLDSSTLHLSAPSNLSRHSLPAPYNVSRTCLTTYPSWRWQLQCLPKRWSIPNIRLGSNLKAEVTY